MIKKPFLVFISAAIMISCAASKKQFGQTIIENTADLNLSKQAILKLKSLDTDIFDSASFVGNEQIEIQYRIFNPIDQKAKEAFPLVVIYHGSGPAIGTDNSSHMGLLQKLFASPEIQNKYPAYVLAPQFPTRSSDYVMDTERNILSSAPRACLNSVFELVDSLKSNLNIDSKRIYVVGFSMGGSTVINSLSARPDLFAAGISIAGIPQFNKIQELSSIPIWLIHGIDDTENPIESDEIFYDEKGSNTRFWKLKEIYHNDIFTTILLGETMPQWLFKQRKK